MEPAAKGASARNLAVRILLFGALVITLRFAYVVTVYGDPCSSGDFCLLSGPPTAAGGVPGDGLTVPSATGSSGGAAFVRVAGDASAATPAALRDLWTSREWRRAVEFYSAVFQDLIVEGFLSPASKCLAVGSPAGHEVLALKEIGVPDAVSVAKKKSPPLVVAASAVVAGDVVLLPFGNASFDFVFAGLSLDRHRRPAQLAVEIARTLKPEGFLAVLTASGGDLYSLRSLLDLFPSCRKIRSREISGSDPAAPLREIVFQKEEGRAILGPGEEISSSGGNSATKCSTGEHKIQILESVEPLIGEEPLKPWITLKRNLKNIKYLPSTADISFKPRYVYVDVGARSYGSSIGGWFRKQYPKQNRTFEIYAIEADRAFHGEYAAKKGVTLLPFAAWVRNETLSFEVNHDPELKEEAKGRGMGRIRPAGGASDGVSADEVHAIRGFDFAEWLNNVVTERDFVVMKMDVEGTEFELVPRLFETGAICLIDELFLECHYNRWQKCCPGQRSPKYQNTYGDCLRLFTSLRESGVLVHQWW